MEELAELLQARDIDFDAADRRMMCFLHVINICCQHIIAAFTNPAHASSVVDFVAESHQGPVDQQTFETAVKRDPIALGCNIVCALQSSSQRRDAVRDIHLITLHIPSNSLTKLGFCLSFFLFQFLSFINSYPYKFITHYV